jgi:hypothetical protein
MTANPAGRFESLDYCALEDVQARLYTGQGLLGSANPPAGQAGTDRDNFLKDLITSTSRRFDEAVWDNLEYPGLFSWILETRLYSGQGQQDLHVGPFASIAKVEVDATPGQDSSTFQDYTVEFSQHRMGFRPIRGYPKQELFRQSTFYQDPFRLGNIRLTGIWGIVQPNDNAAPPNEDWEDQFLDGISTNAGPITVASLAPPNGGWWTTPDDVREAVAEWTAYRYQSSKMPGSNTTGLKLATVTNDKTIPLDVKAVITSYRGQTNVPNFAFAADDGSDIDTYPGGWRWAGWMTHS